MMTSADLDHNDKLLAAPKKEKLEWVTPKISLMGAADSEGKNRRDCEAANSSKTEFGGGDCNVAGTWGPFCLSWHKPAHSNKNQ